LKQIILAHGWKSTAVCSLRIAMNMLLEVRTSSSPQCFVLHAGAISVGDNGKGPV
jgi:hypothetical protein